MSEQRLDLRDLPPPERHPKILDAFDGLEAFLATNDAGASVDGDDPGAQRTDQPAEDDLHRRPPDAPF